MESGILCMFTSALCLITWATGSTIAPGNITRTEDNVSSTRNYIIADDYPSEVQKCWDNFDNRMNRTFHDHWCTWDSVVRFYNDLQICLEYSADILSLAYPNDLAHYTILNAHLKFFINCAVPEEFMDPPENVLLALIFAPICIIPFLVTLVVYKSNTSKPQT
ncbi:receptor activity-modifying protein 2 isoform X1 [Rana temporaria]|uniref:receptor activity-modifying protein 2 isoform X1 n=1 Tax=Rana temporaria TaxID=8407 RepID=UPI001AAD1B42|nr:receptor activity-modifying protein 2 isoform X1 [Rana temporaria]